jgi:uroporphyrinogen-III synthase
VERRVDWPRPAEQAKGAYLSQQDPLFDVLEVCLIEIVSLEVFAVKGPDAALAVYVSVASTRALNAFSIFKLSRAEVSK